MDIVPYIWSFVGHSWLWSYPKCQDSRCTCTHTHTHTHTPQLEDVLTLLGANIHQTQLPENDASPGLVIFFKNLLKDYMLLCWLRNYLLLKAYKTFQAPFRNALTLSLEPNWFDMLRILCFHCKVNVIFKPLKYCHILIISHFKKKECCWHVFI